MDRLQDRRLWLAGGALAAVIVVAVGWLVFIGPKLSDADQLRAQAASTRQQNQVLTAHLGALRTKSTHLSAYTARLRRALAALPPDSGLPTFTREVSAHAAASGVTVSSVAVGGVVAATQPGSATTTTTTPAATTATTSPTTPGATTSATSTALAIPVTLLTTGSLTHQQLFLERLRLIGPRSVLVTSTVLAPAASATSVDGDSVLTTSLTVFSAPQTPAQIAQLSALLNGKIGN